MDIRRFLSMATLTYPKGAGLARTAQLTLEPFCLGAPGAPWRHLLVQHQDRLRPMQSVISISNALSHSGGPLSAREDHSPLGVESDLRGLARSKLFGQGPTKVGGEVNAGAVTRQARLLHLAAVAGVEANAPYNEPLNSVRALVASTVVVPSQDWDRTRRRGLRCLGGCRRAGRR